MRKILVCCALLAFVTPCLTAATDSLYFENLTGTFEDEAEYQRARETSGGTPEFELPEARYWYMKASFIYTSTIESQEDSALQGSPDLKIVPEGDLHNMKFAFDLATKAMKKYESLWAKDKKNNRLNVLYAYGILTYVGIGREIKRIDLIAVEELYFKARNLVNVVISRLPDNVDARYLRVIMTFNIPGAAGRPDSVILEDTKKFIDNIALLPDDLKNGKEYRTYLNFVRLIRAFILEENSKKSEAKAIFAQVDADSLITGIFENLYQQVERKLK